MNISQVERDLLASTRHTGAANMLAHLSGGLPSLRASAASNSLAFSGQRLAADRRGGEHALSLEGQPGPDGAAAQEPPAARLSRISKLGPTSMEMPFCPVDCWDRFAAYALQKDGAGRVRVFDAPTTRRGMVRAHGGAIADCAFATVRGEVLLAAASADGRVSVSHIVPPPADVSSGGSSSGAAAAELAVNVVVSLHLGGAYGSSGSSSAGGAYRPRVAWRPGRAELLVATGVHVLRVDAVALMGRAGAEDAPVECAPGTLPDGVTAHVELPEAATALAIDPTDSELAVGGAQGTIHVCPLDTGANAPPLAATVFRSSGAASPIAFAQYVAPPGGGRAALVTAAEAEGALVLRSWAVDRGAERAEDQVKCVDSARVSTGVARDSGSGWSVSAHVAAGVLVASCTARPGRLATITLHPNAAFAHFAVFGLGRDAAGVRALQVDGHVEEGSASTLQAVAIDGQFIERIFLPWLQVRPAANGASETSAPVTRTPAADVAPAQTAAAFGRNGTERATASPAPASASASDAADAQPPLASARSSLGSGRLLVPGTLVSTSAAASARPDNAATPPPQPLTSQPSTTSTPGSTTRRRSAALLVPGNVSNDSQRGSLHTALDGTPLVSARSSVATGATAAAPTAVAQPADPATATPGADSFTLFDASAPLTTGGDDAAAAAVAPDPSAAEAAAEVAAPSAAGAGTGEAVASSSNTGLDLLKSMFAEQPAADGPAGATAAAATAAEQLESVLPPPVGTANAAAASNSVNDAANAAAAAAAAHAASAMLAKTPPAGTSLVGTPTGETAAGRKKRQRNRSKPGESSASAGAAMGANANASTADGQDSTSAAIAEVAAKVEAQVKTVSDGLDELRGELGSLAAAVKSQNEQVSAALKRVEKGTGTTSSIIGQIPSRVTKDMQALVTKSLEAAAPDIIGARVDAAVQGAFASAFSSAVVPAFERAMQNMFTQLNDAFNSGMAEHAAVAQAAAAAAAEQQRAASDAFLTRLATATSALSDLAKAAAAERRSAAPQRAPPPHQPSGPPQVPQAAQLAMQQQHRGPTLLDSVYGVRTGFPVAMQPPVYPQQLAQSASQQMPQMPDPSAMLPQQRALPSVRVGAPPAQPQRPASLSDEVLGIPRSTPPLPTHVAQPAPASSAASTPAVATGGSSSGATSEGGLRARFNEALTKQDPEALLVPLCVDTPPERAAGLNDEFRVCIVQQILTVLDEGGSRPATEYYALLRWAAECLRDVRALHNEAFRETYEAILEEAQSCVKALLKTAEYKSAVYEQAAALGQLVMERHALLRG